MGSVARGFHLLWLHVQVTNPWTFGLPILFDSRIPIKMKAAVPAPHFHSSPQLVVLPGCAAALSLHALARTIEEDKPPLSSSQTSSINVVESERFNSTGPHRFLPLRTVNGGAKPMLEADDDMTRFVDHRLSSILF